MQLRYRDSSERSVVWYGLGSQERLPSSLGTVADFITDAVIKAAFLTFLTSFSSFTDRRSAKAVATSKVGNSDSDSALLHLSVKLPTGLSCTNTLTIVKTGVPAEAKYLPGLAVIQATAA